MISWPWDFVRPIRTYFARRRRSRWKQNWTKGICPSCKLPFDNGKKRCVVDSCGHDRCYSCLCVQDTCPICIREVVTYRTSKKLSQRNENAEKRKSNEITMRAFMNITNEPSLSIPRGAAPSGIYQKGQQEKRHSQISNINDYSFENMISSIPECFLTLKPLYFEVPQTESENAFLYREWIFQEINKVISSELSGVVLVGDEGSGKTTLILQLVDWSSFGRKRKSGIINEGIMNEIATFENLASKVVGYHFCQADCSETCSVPDFVHSLAAQLCQAPQLLEYRNVLKQDVSCQQALSLKNCVKDPDTALKKGILKPLHSLKNSSLTTELLVIDNIHEAEGQTRSIISFLAKHMEEFPSWLKVVLTIKTIDVHKVHSLPVHRINLDCSEHKVQEDLFRYARSRINKSPVIQTNICSFGDENQVSRFVEHLVTGGQATFLFMRLVLDLFQQNYLVIKSTTFNVIPISLDEVFTLTFNLKFPSTATFLKVKAILEICLASQSPLSALEIFYAIESASVFPQLKWMDFTKTLRSLYGILIQRKDESLMISHPALRNWLMKNEKFVCDIRLGHTFLALLPTRIRFSLSKEKEIELIYHLSFCNVFEDEKKLQAVWLHHSSVDVSNVFIHPRTIFWADPKIIQLFLESGAYANSMLNNPKKSPIINEACKLGNVEVIVLLLKFGASVDNTDLFGVTPLIEVAEAGHLKVIEILLNAGAKIHIQDNVGRCSLSCAAEKGHLEIVNFLIQSKYWTSPTLRSRAIQRACVAASGAGKFQVCECLVKIGNITSSDGPLNQLKSACVEGQTAVCRLFLKNSHSAPENLRLAAFWGHISTLNVLADTGVDINTKDEFGRNVLFWACINNRSDAVRFLLGRKANITANDLHVMPIHLSAIYGDAGLIRLLLDNSADPELTNEENDTALESAIKAENFSSVIELLKSGVKIRDKAFVYAKDQSHVYSSLLCKLFSEGITLFKEGQISDASQRFEYGLQKCTLENFQRLFHQFQEQLEECKRININKKLCKIQNLQKL